MSYNIISKNTFTAAVFSAAALTLAAASFLVFANKLDAQTKRSESRSPDLLDRWIVQHYRGAQLLPDSSGGAATVVRDAPLPRVEYVHDSKGDTLVGIHFASRPSAPLFGVASTAKLAVPTGAITTTSGKVVARRLFRAPRVPNASMSDSTKWRYGWAYVVVLPRQRDMLPAQAMRGWLLVLTGS